MRMRSNFYVKFKKKKNCVPSEVQYTSNNGTSSYKCTLGTFCVVIPPQTLFVVGILFSRYPCVCLCVRVSVRAWVRNVLCF